jgi:hypothetical protein
MLKLSQKISLLSTIILGFGLVIIPHAVAEEPSDTQFPETTAQSAPFSADGYGCLRGYSDDTYRGNQPLTRYEFAAAMDACLNQFNQLINNRRANLATQEDLATTKRQLETLNSELERLQMRLDGLDTEEK